MAFAGASGAELDRADDGSGLACLVRRLRKLARQVTRDARRFEQLPFARQHLMRKRLKRLRYLAEFAAPAFHRGEVDAWLKKIAPAQDRLGKYIDEVQAGVRFAALASTQPGAWFALGWLRAQAERSARASRKSLERLRRSKAFWAGTRGTSSALGRRCTTPASRVG
jgi:CHAD domain-containing protein